MAVKKSKKKLQKTKKKRRRRKKEKLMLKITMTKAMIKITILSQGIQTDPQAAVPLTRRKKRKQRKNRQRKTQNNSNLRLIKNQAKMKREAFSQKMVKIRSFWRSNKLQSSITI